MVCEKDGVEYEIDSRTSDAVAMAVRLDCPIYTYEFILESAGVELEEGESKDNPISTKIAGSKSAGETYERMSEDSLTQLLEDVLASEDYEKAAKIRDELLRRKSKE